MNLPTHKIVESKVYSMGIVPNYIKHSDSVLGEITIFPEEGRIVCDNFEKRNINGIVESFEYESFFEYRFKIDMNNKSDEILNNKVLYIENIKYIYLNKNKIENYIMDYICKKIKDHICIRMHKKIDLSNIIIKGITVLLDIGININENIRISVEWINIDNVIINNKKLYYGYKIEKFNVFLNKNDDNIYLEEDLSKEDEVLFASEHRISNIPVILKLYLRKSMLLDEKDRKFVELNFQKFEKNISSSILKKVIKDFHNIPIRALCENFVIKADIVGNNKDCIDIIATWNESEYLSDVLGFLGSASIHINKDNLNVVIDKIKSDNKLPIYKNVYLKDNIPILLQVNNYDNIDVTFADEISDNENAMNNIITGMFDNIMEWEQLIANEIIDYVAEVEFETGTVDYISVVVNSFEICEEEVWCTASLQYWCWSSTENVEDAIEGILDIRIDKGTGKLTSVSVDW